MTRRMIFAGLLLFGLAQIACADDLSIFAGKYVGVKPNVLLILDNSVDMDNCIGTNNSADMMCNYNVKMRVVRDALLNFLDSPQVDNVRLGLMTYVKGSGGVGAKVHLPCGSSVSALKAKINDIAGTDTGNPPRLPSPLNDAAVLYPYRGVKGAPLGDPLAEAGLYFAGQGSAYLNLSTWPAPSRYSATETAVVDGVANTVWYQNAAYKSPITSWCQKNYIIFLTTSTEKRYDTFYNPYINGIIIEDRIGSGYELRIADEVADFLYKTDLSPLDDVQHLRTNIIAFDVDPLTEQTEDTKKATIDARALFAQVAKDGNGGEDGHYYTIGSKDENIFKQSLLIILDNLLKDMIVEANSTYVSPVIPRQPNNQTDAGDRVYMALFKPQENGRWAGNLKAFGLVNGVLMDSSTPPVAATDSNGNIRDSAKSYWSAAADGMKVGFGGVGGLLANNNSRNVYTFTESMQAALNHTDNRFAEANVQLTAAQLGVNTAADRTAIITQTLAGVPIKREDGTILVANWRLGDIVHSEPLVKYYKDPNNDGVIAPNESKSYIFVGANDGMLHVFNAADGSEAWAFIPPGQLANLKKRTSLNAGSEHNYFVDGSPVVESVEKSDGTIMQLLVFGERRGGKRYYALDVTNPDLPTWRYQLTDSMLTTLDWDFSGGLDGAAASLGQSWAKPQFKKVSSGNQIKEVFLLAGGYDTNQDATTPAATDAMGKAVYTILAESGEVFGLNINAGNWKDTSGSPYMTHSILDVTGFDVSQYGYMDRIYAGDLGGNIFAARYNRCTNIECNNDNWEKMVLFDLPDTITVNSVTSNLGQKFMTKPEVTLEPYGECAYLGTGDREKPNSTAAVDAFYAICNNWEKDANGVLMTRSFADLVDVTDNLVQQGTDVEKDQVSLALQNGRGWYIRMSHAGEKVVSTPKVLNKKVYFTTFTPGNSSVGNYDPCTVSYDFGVSRLYVLDYKTGAAVYDLSPGGNQGDPLTKEDRSIVIGTSIAPDPVLVTTGETTTIIYGSGGRLGNMPVETSQLIRKYFWRQLK